MYACGQFKRYGPGVLIVLVFLIKPVSCFAEEIAGFRLTNADGFFGLGYRYDADITRQIAGAETKDTRSVVEEEFNVQTQGYVYHPRLLKVNLGAGILFNQEKLKTSAGEAENEGTFYNINTSLLFLEEKPYPLTLYYNKSHPSVALNVTDVFTQENEKYGMNFSLREPFSPVSLNFEAYKQSAIGNSFTQVVDDRNSYQSVSANTSLKNGGNVQLTYSENQQASMSGSKNFPISPFNMTTETTDLTSVFILGQKRNVNLNVLASQINQTQDRELDEIRFSPYLSWKHSDDLNSYYRYNLTERKQTNIDTRSTSGASGVGYQWTDNVFSNAELHFNDNKSTGLKLNSYGATGSVAYKHQLGFALMQFNAGLNYDVYDREAGDAVKVEDAPYTLNGTAPVTLANEDIDIATIVVKRADTNEVLAEGLLNDYIIIPIANQTQIQKINPALPADLDVLITYDYNPGGTATYDSLGQHYQVSLGLDKHVTFYMKYRDSKKTLKAGSPSLPLDSSDTSTYGMRVEYPLPTDIELTLGGEVLSENHNEDTSSYHKKSADIFMQIALPLSSNLHMRMYRLQVDNLFSTEDVDMTSYSLRLTSHPVNRLAFSLQFQDEKDTGGSLSRSSRRLIFSSQWRVRKLRFEMSAKRVFDTQGSIKHDRTIFNANLRRDF